MNSLSAHFLVASLIILILLAAFFSSTETGMMSINRYRLRHLERKHHAAAIRVGLLLSRPDRLLGIILIGSTFTNIFASAVATLLAVRWWGDLGVTISTFILTLVMLIFAEITPKILAALYPEQVSFFASYPLKFLMRFLYPLVWVSSGTANMLLRLFRVKRVSQHKMELTQEELRTVVYEAVGKSSSRYQEMLLSILDLGKVTVEDIMIPRNDIVGIDLDQPWPTLQAQMQSCQHTRLPIFHASIDNVEGILHIRKVLNLVADSKFTKQELIQAADPVYFIPEGTALNNQLINFQQQKERIGLVVDEYGDIQGLVTLEDILEEIVGQFTTDLASSSKDILPQKDGTFLVDGSTSIREINKSLDWNLPVDGPKTLNGLILEHLQTIPSTVICLKIFNYPLEVVEIEGNFIKTVKLHLPKRKIGKKQTKT